MDEEQATPSLSQAQRLKKFSAEGKLGYDAMSAIMSEEKKGDLDKVVLNSDVLKKYFPKSYTPLRMQPNHHQAVGAMAEKTTATAGTMKGEVYAGYLCKRIKRTRYS